MADCQIEFRKSAEKDLRRIDAQHLPRIIQAIENLSSNPLPAGIRKLVGGDRTYRIRVGDYRVIYQFSPGHVIVERVHVYRD